MSPDPARSVTNRLRGLAKAFDDGTAYLMAGRVLQNLNGFLLSVIIVHRFGLASAGTLAVSAIGTALLALLGTFGLPYTLARLPLPPATLNYLGFVVALAVVPLALPLAFALGLAAGRDPGETAEIALLAMGGTFFAQINLANALLVLQRRLVDFIVLPLGNLAGLLVAAWLADDLVEFAVILGGFRFVGVLLVFLRLPRQRMAWRQLLACLIDGLNYLTADGINLGADQLTLLVLSYLVGRADLGIYGLCRQLLTVSDTPGWSKLQAAYPGVVRDPVQAIPVLRRQMLVIGLTCTACAMVLTLPLGLWIYHSTQFTYLGLLILASVPCRYLVGTYDLGLRGMGAVAATNRISLQRGAIGLVLIPVAALCGGILGSVAAVVGQAAVAAWLTWRTALLALDSLRCTRPRGDADHHRAEAAL